MDKTHIIIKDENWWKKIFNDNSFELERILTELMELKISGTNITAEETVFMLNSKNIMKYEILKETDNKGFFIRVRSLNKAKHFAIHRTYIREMKMVKLELLI